MKKLILALIVLTSSVYSFEKKDDSFTYSTLGTDLIVPSIGMGIRKWGIDGGYDLNGSFSSLIFINRLAASASYLKKFNDNNYIGIGGGAFLALFSYDNQKYLNGGVFPSLKFGKESENSFHEISIAIPQISNHGIMFLPLISYRYGF